MKPRALGPAACAGNLAPDILGYENPLSIMDLLFGKLVLMDYEGTELRHRYPSAETFALLAERLAGVEVDGVTRLEVPERPNLLVLEVRRHRRGPLLVVWTSATPSTGRTSRRWRSTGRGRQHGPSLSTRWPGAPAEVLDGRVKLQVSLTPMIIAAD